MNMIAIKLAKGNEEKILAEADIAPDDLDKMIEEFEHHKYAPLYFIPVYDAAKRSRFSWATFPAQPFREDFKADMRKINTQFVEITRK